MDCCNQGEASGVVRPNRSMLPGLHQNQTSSSLYESSITLIRSDRLW